MSNPSAASRRLNRVLVAAVGALVAAQLAEWAIELTAGRSLSFHVYGSGLANDLIGLAVIMLASVAALVISRRPKNPVGWLLFTSCFVNLLSPGLALYAAVDIQQWHRSAPLGDFVAGVQSYLWIPALLLVAILPAQLFPDGRLVSRRWRPLVYLSVFSVVAGYLGRTFGPSRDNYLVPGAVAPKLHHGLAANVLNVLSIGLLLVVIALLLSVVSLVVRYRRASSEVRHQIRWLIVAVVVYLVPFAVHGELLDRGVDVQWLADFSLIGQGAIPIAMAVAILKYRLYDIDVVINRALVYGTLAAFITAVYVGIVVGIGSLVGAAGRPNLVLSIVATALVAVAFQPVRERVQRVANRAVYGKRADPYELLSRFSAHVGDSYAPNEVLSRMAAVLGEGMGAKRTGVWLRVGDRLLESSSWPAPPGRPSVASSNGHVGEATVLGQLLPLIAGPDRVVAVREHGELLGALTVEKRPGEALTPVEEKLLDDLARQAGLVLKNVGLTAQLMQRLEELRTSRQRLVTAQDQERRRIERNLHDGAQQHLVALKVHLGLAERLTGDPAKFADAIRGLKSETDEALETLRDLARGIYPPLLADQGLVVALQSQARKAILPVEVKAAGVRRYPQDVEAAMYFCCLEALQNVQKYAAATGVTIRVGEVDGLLRLEVEDDGTGFDAATRERGSGLTNIGDRVDALGGDLEVRSHPGQGTTIMVTVPVTSRETAAARSL